MISRSASYAIRAMAFIASAEPETRLLSRDIAAVLELPPQFLSKILRTLVGRGLLQSRPGKSGGFRLARPADTIVLIEIVDPFDRLIDRRRCLLGLPRCSEESGCPLHGEWRPFVDSFIEVLTRWKLTDMATATATTGGPVWRGGATT
ncbi:MAG: Rrf2 family transcriptional regulator [Candidatus Eisenbacteria bacterium]